MKYLFLILILAGCKKDGYYYVPKDTFDRCESLSQGEPCGATVYDCNSGKSYFCEHDVKEVKK